MAGMDFEPTLRRRVYAELIARFQAAGVQERNLRWRMLEAAHVVGQHDLRLHVHSHAAMFRLAATERDGAEAAGQLLRLALVPLGHALGRLPAGNIGRATVNAFAPMPVSDALRRTIAHARDAVAAKSGRREADGVS